MNYRIGDHVMYISVGVCTVTGFEDKCFDGKTMKTYIELVPETAIKTVCYLPEDMAGEKLRRLKSPEEVKSLIARIPEITPCQEAARNLRRTQFSEILKSDDTAKIISLVKLLQHNRSERESAGKHLSASEENTLKAALALVSQEFATVLGISETEAASRICEKIA